MDQDTIHGTVLYRTAPKNCPQDAPQRLNTIVVDRTRLMTSWLNVGVRRCRRLRKRVRMAREIYFVRHGESTANIARVISNRETDNAPLTKKGRQQAGDLLTKLRNQGGVTIVYTSPLLRAKETAEIIAAGLWANTQIADALREPFCGLLEGRGDKAAWSCHAKQEEEWQNGNSDYHVPGGESLRDVEKRFRPFIENIASEIEEAKGNIVIVSHGSVLMNMLPHIFSNINADFARTHALGYCEVVIAVCQESDLRCVEWCGLALDDA